jgi:hypothetical protein
MCCEAPQDKHAFWDEKRVAHCESFVNDHSISMDISDHGESSPNRHAAGTRLERLIEKVSDTGKRCDVKEAGIDLIRGAG